VSLRSSADGDVGCLVLACVIVQFQPWLRFSADSEIGRHHDGTHGLQLAYVAAILAEAGRRYRVYLVFVRTVWIAILGRPKGSAATRLHPTGVRSADVAILDRPGGRPPSSADLVICRYRPP
jgi:hypothetical protein